MAEASDLWGVSRQETCLEYGDDVDEDEDIIILMVISWINLFWPKCIGVHCCSHHGGQG